MSKTTTYDISILYRLDDKASQGLDALGRRAGAAEERALGLKEAMIGLGAVAAAHFAFEKGKEAFVAFNDRVEQAKIGIASITKMFHKDMTFDDAEKKADDFFSFYQDAAKKSTGTTMDFLEMHKGLAPALEKAGASAEDFKKIVTGATVTAPLFGERADVVQLDIKQMMMGTVAQRDRTAQTIIAMMGETVDKFNAKVKADPRYGIDFIKRAFDSDALKQARSKMEHTFSGAVSTLKDNIEISLGKAGKPLFDALSGVLNDVNAWIDKHPAELEDWGKKLGGYLKDGFNALRKGVDFVVQNKDTLMHLAEAFVAFKLMGGGLGSLGGVVGNLDSFGKSLFGIGDNLTKFGAGLNSAIPALSAFTAAMVYIAGEHEKAQKVAVGAKADRLALEDAVSRGDWKSLRSLTKDIGVLKDGQLNGPALKEWIIAQRRASAFGGEDIMGFSAKSEKDALRTAARAAVLLKDHLGDAMFPGFPRIYDPSKPKDLVSFDVDESKRKAAGKTNVNVTIQKIEVASQDPDRFAFGLDRAFKKVVQNPTQARDALRGGF